MATRPRWLDLAPSSRLLATLSAQTGIAIPLLRRMTFHGLGRELVPTVLASRPLCPRCVAESTASGPKIEFLHEIAPWRFACARHRPSASLEEAGRGLDQISMLRDVTLFSMRLEAAAFQDPSRPFPPIARSTADCIRLVRAVNDRIRFHVRPGRKGAVVFDMQAIPPEPEGGLPPARRNRVVVSAWYAWHVMTDPACVLWRHTRCATAAQARELVGLLAGFLPGEQMIAARRQIMALLDAAPLSPSSTISDGAARQAGLLSRLMLVTPGDRPRRSPFEYPDFGRRFIPAFYRPGFAIAADGAASRLRASVWPTTPLPAPSRLPSPVPLSLAPYEALVIAARAELAREAGDGPVRPRAVARRAGQLLRRWEPRGRPTRPWPGTGGR